MQGTNHRPLHLIRWPSWISRWIHPSRISWLGVVMRGTNHCPSHLIRWPSWISRLTHPSRISRSTHPSRISWLGVSDAKGVRTPFTSFGETSLEIQVGPPFQDILV